MATRTRRTWRPAAAGQYVRQLGWKASRSGKLAQPKFRLGTDLREARRREIMLTQLWEHAERRATDKQAVWPDDLLEMARQIARDGTARIARREGESGDAYAWRFGKLRQQYPGVAITAADEQAFLQGAHACFSEAQGTYARFERFAGDIRQGYRDALGDQADEAVVGGPTLHEALRDHIEWLKGEYADGDDGVTPWGRTRIKHAEALLDRHDDTPLGRLGHEQLEEMIRYWRQRPPRKGTTRPIAKKSAEHQIAAVRFFVRWLSRSTKYEWKKPDTFDEIRARVGSRVDDVRRQVTPEDIFTLDDWCC